MIYTNNGIDQKLQTTVGIIHYDAKGFAHIRPAQPIIEKKL